MSTLTIREYIPKVPNTITHKLPPRPCWTIPGKESTKPSAKAAEDNEWRKKLAPVSELMSQENALFNTEKAHGQITRRENSEDDNSDLLKRHRARFNRKSPEEGSQESRAGSSSDEPIELDSKLDLDEDLETTHVHCAQGGGQPNNDALDIETLLVLPNGPADEPYNSISTVDTNPSSSSAKRVRLASPCQIPDLGLSTPPYSCDGDRKRSMTDSESSGSGESQDGTFSPKRRKPSPQGVETALNGHYGQLERSPSVVSGYGLRNHSDDSHPSTASLSTPAAPDSALEASRICPQFVDINQEWEYREIIGEEIVDGVPCYEMEWCSSLIPKTWVQNNELVTEYEARKARAHAYQRVKKGRKGRPDLKQGCRAVEAAGASAGQRVKRPRGRSRKQR